MDGGAWRDTVHGVTKSRTRLSTFTFTYTRLVIAFLPRSKRLLISWLQSPSAVILEPLKIKSVTVCIVSPSICHEVMGQANWPWTTEWSSWQRRIEFCQENALVIANTLFQQHKRWLYTWTSPDRKKSEVAQSCLTLCDPVDCSRPSSSVHGVLQARILEWVAISFSRGSSQPRDQIRVSCIAGRRFILWATREADWLYSLQPKMEKLYTVSKNKTRSWLWLRSWIPYCQIQM